MGTENGQPIPHFEDVVFGIIMIRSWGVVFIQLKIHESKRPCVSHHNVSLSFVSLVLVLNPQKQTPLASGAEYLILLFPMNAFYEFGADLDAKIS